MMRTEAKLACAVLLLTGSLMTAGGCSYAKNTENNLTTRQHSRGQADMIQVPEEARKHRANGELRVTPDQLARIAEQVPGVDKANIVMNDRDVLVGIEVDDIGKRKIIEKQVTSALHWQYAEFDYHVTADETLRNKIISVSSKTAKGHERKDLLNRDIDALAKVIDQSIVKRR
ncbi:YhcN/YlaJ family sporulation lipoprotein [Paenibacillus sp. GCM10027627]|uniref:YhcN/YlaJ family sporulation lipoprotein n=1 Tax=unclassified Paenibacillus TaxID=185978 RepID=UPI0036371E62